MQTISRLASVVAILSCAFPVAAEQSRFDAFYDVGSIATNASASNAITRQSSCAIQLKNFTFSEVQLGSFVPQLTISFRSSLPSGGYDEVNKITVLFDDVIKEINKNKQVSLKLSNQLLASGVNLTRVTNAHVELRLHRVKDNYADFAAVVGPLLNTVQSGNPGFAVIDNLLSKVQDGPLAPIVFSADFLIAGNVIEYQRLASTSLGNAFLKNNQEYLILINSNTPVAENSLRSKVAGLINLGAKALVGSQIIDPSTENVKGFATLVFTKDRLPLLPADLEEQLREVGRALTRSTFDSVAFDAAAARAEGTNAYLESNRTVDPKSASTIVEFLSLAKVYATYRRSTTTLVTNWGNEFSDWLFGFRIRSPSLAAQSIAVRGIYSAAEGKSYVAPMYLPYFLPDDLLLTAQFWQLQLHRSLAGKENRVAAAEVDSRVAAAEASR